MTGKVFRVFIFHSLSSFLLSSSNSSVSVSNALLFRFCLSSSSSLLPLSPNCSSVLRLLPYPSNSAKAEIFVSLWRDRSCLFWCVCYGAFVLLHFMFSATKFHEILSNLKWIIGFTFLTSNFFYFHTESSLNILCHIYSNRLQWSRGRGFKPGRSRRIF